MRLALMLFLIGFATTAFAQKDGVRLVTVEYKPESDTYEIIELLGTTEYSAPSTSLSFSSGNGILVKDIDRLNKLLTTKQNAMFLPDQTSVPEVLKGMLAPATIVIFNRDPKALDPNINPIFAARAESRVQPAIQKVVKDKGSLGSGRPQWHQRGQSPNVAPAYGYESISGNAPYQNNATKTPKTSDRDNGNKALNSYYETLRAAEAKKQ